MTNETSTGPAAPLTAAARREARRAARDVRLAAQEARRAGRGARAAAAPAEPPYEGIRGAGSDRGQAVSWREVAKGRFKVSHEDGRVALVNATSMTLTAALASLPTAAGGVQATVEETVPEPPAPLGNAVKPSDEGAPI